MSITFGLIFILVILFATDPDGDRWFGTYIMLLIIVGMIVVLIQTDGAYKIHDTSTGKVLYVAGRPFSDSVYLKITRLNGITTSCTAYGTTSDRVRRLDYTSDYLLLHITPNKFDWVDKEDIPTGKVHRVDCDSMRIETVQESYKNGRLVGDIEIIRCYKDGESRLVTFRNNTFSPEMLYQKEEEVEALPYW